MAYFSKINSTRRFIGPEGQVLAIYDQSRSHTLYAKVGCDELGCVSFVSEPRSYWSDEIEEVR